MPTLEPLDTQPVVRAARKGGLVTVEEHSVTGGLGSAAADILAERRLACRVRKFGLPDEVSTEIGSQAYLRKRATWSPRWRAWQAAVGGSARLEWKRGSCNRVEG